MNIFVLRSKAVFSVLFPTMEIFEDIQSRNSSSNCKQLF